MDERRELQLRGIQAGPSAAPSIGSVAISCMYAPCRTQAAASVSNSRSAVFAPAQIRTGAEPSALTVSSAYFGQVMLLGDMEEDFVAG